MKIQTLLISCLTLCSQYLLADNPALSIKGIINTQLQWQDKGSQSWISGGDSGLRYSHNDNLWQISQAGADLHYALTPNQRLTTSLSYFGGDREELALTEAYWRFKPIPSSRWHHQLRLGLFHLPGSFENPGRTWSSPYSDSFSVINTWIGEELRIIGAEWLIKNKGKYRQSDWDFNIRLATYSHNDTAATMLAWRGWASHDRISGLNSDYPIADLPQLRHNGVFYKQAPLYEPFVEVDNRLGGYIGTEFSFKRKWQLNALYYNNQGKPTALKKGQYGWRTKFYHLGAKYKHTNGFEIFGQYLNGSTEMGKYAGILADYSAAYITFSQRWKKHRLSLRFEEFDVTDKDTTPTDTNTETGRAWQMAYSYNFAKQWKLLLSYTDWKSNRPGRHYIPGHRVMVDTDTAHIGLRYYW